ncbi:HAD family phosphatase [Candidatus Parcubacteria bacterium]|nr:MAG: HAD family phosphatase [Candidatus Parcubacteria bacterium]
MNTDANDIRIKSVIFDMDGVISDTQILHSRIESEILRDYKINLAPEELTRRFAGVADVEMFTKIFSEAGRPAPDIQKIIEAKYLRMISPEVSVPEIPGTREFIMQLRKMRIPLALASGSSLAFIRFVLQNLGLDDCFGAVASSDEVENGKPAPDVFLLAAQRIGAGPATTLVIEDGASGMIAAEKAGMHCIALLTHLRADECPSSVYRAVDILTQVPLNIFER